MDGHRIAVLAAALGSANCGILCVLLAAKSDGVWSWVWVANSVLWSVSLYIWIDVYRTLWRTEFLISETRRITEERENS